MSASVTPSTSSNFVLLNIRAVCIAVGVPSRGSAPAFFSTSDKGWIAGGGGDWSEMVADEGANGTAQLPVIDFADLVVS